VAYELEDTVCNGGGFGCLAGSHKGHYPVPEAWIDLSKGVHPMVTRVPARAGTAIIFTEALTHGPLPWTANHERRTIFYKYSPNPLAWWGEYPTPAGLEGLTERQREILEGPNARYPERGIR